MVRRLAALFILISSAALALSADVSAQAVFEGPPARASCGPGSMPEQGLQGEVSIADRASGRSAQGYTCNLQQLGHYSGEGAEWQMATYGHCAYYDQKFPGLGGTELSAGTVVMDVSDPAHPVRTATLISAAMLDPWESLKVNRPRGLLGGVFAPAQGAGVFDVYDVKSDCAHPKLLSSSATSVFSHEGEWSPDGKTYYSTGLLAGTVTAIDVTDPARPRTLATFEAGSIVHGLGVSPDGTRMYLALINTDFATGFAHATNLIGPDGMAIYDISQIQARKPSPTVRKVGQVTWKDGSTGQHAIPFTMHGHPYAIFVDELGRGGPRIIDLGDETRPRVISKLRLAIQMNDALATKEELSPVAPGGRIAIPRGLLPFGYNAHYCNLDSRVDPTIAVCSEFESGIRVFDIRDLSAPREIAYFNPGGDGTLAPGSWGGTTSGFTSALPYIDAKDGEIWFTDQDRGFYTIKFTNGVWPFATPRPGCLSRRVVSYTLPRGATDVSIRQDGRRRSATRHGRQLAVDLRGTASRSVRIDITARVGAHRFHRSSRIHLCRPL